MAPKTNPDANRFGEIGVSGVKIQSGVVHDEFLRELHGRKGRETFKQMAYNDATIAAFLHAFETLVRKTDWTVTPADNTAAAQREAEFLQGVLFEDMSHSWDDFLSEVLTFLIYGWSYFEIVLKRRSGPRSTSPSRRSRFRDGRIGVRKLAPRSQDTLDRWKLDDDGGIQGLWQWPPLGGVPTFIPIERSLLFRTKTKQGNPEGQSVLRGAYRSWYYKNQVEISEAIGIERDLAGMPIARVPNEVLTDPDKTAQLEAYRQMVRDVRMNSQGGIVLPSDTYEDSEGNPTGTPRVDFSLVSSAGQRTIDTNAVILRYQRDIARSVLSDFLMLGSTGNGSFALSKSKTDLFLQSLESFTCQIRDTLNRHLVPRLWQMNNLDEATMPLLSFGDIAPVDLDELGNFLRNIAGAGIPLGPDDRLEDALREQAGLPESEPEL